MINEHNIGPNIAEVSASGFITTGILGTEDYKVVPYMTGQVSILNELANKPLRKLTRVAFLGDSQETAPGGNGRQYIDVLNAISNRIYGTQGETRFNYNASYGGGSPFNVWCCRGTNLSTTTSGLAANLYLPNIPRNVINNTANGPTVMLQPGGDTNGPETALRKTWYPIADQLNNLYAEVYLMTNTSSPERVRIFVKPHTTSSITVAATTVQTLTSPAMDLASNTPGIVYKTTFGPLAVDPAKPYMQVMVQGWNGSAITTGLEYLGMRYVLANKKGLVFDSFSAGGYRATDFLGNHANSLPMLRDIGPWDALILSYGVNDAGSVTSSQYQTNMTSLINSIRAVIPNIPIILVSDTPSNGYTAPQLAEFDKFAAVGARIAETVANCVFLNQRRCMFEAGFVSPTGEWTVDGVHHSPLSNVIRANLLWEAILSQTWPKRYRGV